MVKSSMRVLVVCALLAGVPALATAQIPPAPGSSTTPPAAAVDGGPAQQNAAAPVTTFCGNEVDLPENLPPAGSAPVLWLVEICFPKQPEGPFVDGETYTYYIKLPGMRSDPRNNVWRPYNDTTERQARDDFRALWDQALLDDLFIRTSDVTFPNGAIGKVVSYVMEERSRVKIVTYEGSKAFDRSKLEEHLKERNLQIAADSRLDERRNRQVEAIVREMMQEKGFSADVSSEVVPIPNSAKTVNLTFHIDEGRKVKIRKVDFIGNSALSDGKLRRQLKDNKPTNMLSWITSSGVWNATKFEEDAERVRDYYQNRGYANATVGQPDLRIIEDSENGKTQFVEVRIPVTEGPRYNFGTLDFDGNKVIRTDYLQSAYAVKPGDVYSRKKLVEGQKKAQQAYGSYGFMDFTALPDLMRSDSPTNPESALTALVPAALAPLPAESDGKKTPHVDVTVRITEGEQFLIRRINFTGNTTTRDNVIRRELGSLVEGAPFNTEALKDSVRRLNQLGYFKTLEGNEKDVKVDKTGAANNLVDITMKLEEQNRNQLTFGAGISQYEGFFGQLAFQTSNFLGRGETFSVSLQGGERAQNYQVGFTEPFLFDRNITGGIDLHKRALQYIGYYTQKSTGGNLTFGVPLRSWTRMFVQYSYEEVSITDLNEALIDNSCIFSDTGCSTISSLNDLSQLTPTQVETLRRNPFVYDSLLLGQGGKRTISKVVPTVLHNTLNSPIFPTQGRKYTASLDLAVLGGNTKFYKPHLEGIWYMRHTSRTSLGIRGLFEYIAPIGDTPTLPDGSPAEPGSGLPVFERLFLGGEYSIRGYDIRSIGPTVPNSQVVLGGNKSVLFNAEYAFTIAEPVRVLLFYDAGQVRDFGQNFGWHEDLTRIVVPDQPVVIGAFGDIVRNPNAPGVTTEVVGRTSAFKTSTGVEVRFFMPVLNVPFRLIYAWNPQRGGVLDNNLRDAKSKVFKFSVGTTF